MQGNQCRGHNQEDIRKAKEGILDQGMYEKLSLFYKSFSDITRLKIMSLLLAGELCVCDIAVAMNMSQPAISHQMRILKGSGIVKGRRDGKMIYYSLDDEHISLVFQTGKSHIEHL